MLWTCNADHEWPVLFRDSDSNFHMVSLCLRRLQWGISLFFPSQHKYPIATQKKSQAAEGEEQMGLFM